MKKVLLTALALVLCFSVFSQNVVPILQQQNFFVDWCGPFNCNNKAVYKIVLPPHTIKWYYSITAYNKKEESEKAMGLATQLASAADPVAGIAAGLASELISLSPAIFNVRLISPEDVNAFKNGMQYNYYNDGFRESYQGGIVDVTQITNGSIYIAITNPSDFKGLYFSLEAAAVVKDRTVWDDLDKKTFYTFYHDKYYNESLMDNNYADYMATYVCNKIYSNYIPESWDNAATDKKNADVKKYAEDAVQELLGPISENATRSVTYDKLASKSLSSKDYAKSIEYATKAVEYDKTNISAIETLGLAYTLNGQSPEGLECYIDAIELIKKYKYRYLVNQRMNTLKSNLKRFQKANPTVNFSELTELVKSEKMSFFE